MAAKQFQRRTEEEIEQFLWYKNSKLLIYSNKVLAFVIWINIYDLWLILYANYCDL